MVLKMESKIKSQKDATNYIKKKRKKTRQNKNKLNYLGSLLQKQWTMVSISTLPLLNQTEELTLVT